MKPIASGGWAWISPWAALIAASIPTLAWPAESGPVLRTAEQVHLLTREEAARPHRAVIRGVVTCSLPWSEAAVIQDASRGIYVDRLDARLGQPPTVGDLLEVEGSTDPGEFAPQLHADRLTRLGVAELPQPIRPTWDQLINGSLDSQFVELQGVATAIDVDGVSLLTHGGTIKALLFRSQAGTSSLLSKSYENSLLRLRGCLFASWDGNTHQVRVGEIRMFSPSVVVDEAAPKDVFSVALKRVPELLLFDPQASALRRVKVAGQIVQHRGGEFYMMDGTNGLRFIPRQATGLAMGDTVEVVGFPSLTGPSIVLREAFARKTGRAPLPAAQPLTVESLFRAEHDATRVSVEAVLLNVSTDQKTLDMQAGLRRFEARLSSNALFRLLPLGSRVEVSGVYAGRGGNRTTGTENDSFELLVNSPADLRLLARPPWWTLRWLLALVGTLGGVLVVAVVWIRLLHHKVQERTAQLQREVREREHAERQRVLAMERARIARDLHDDLGSSLTEITMLATTSPGAALRSEEASERLGAIAGKSRTIIHALDEIVWAIDPERDTLASVARYLASYVEELLAGSHIACRVQFPNSFPDQVVPGEVRHHLFLAVKETLNNAIRHSRATEIAFRVRLLDGQVQISIRDNGNGFDLPDHPTGNGLLNLRKRLTELSGDCHVQSAPGAGTTVSFQVPLLSGNGH
jgi:signal transduction histidine kinase